MCERPIRDGWVFWEEVFTLSSFLCDLYSVLKGRRAAPVPGLSDLSHSHHSPARRANRSASLLKCPCLPRPLRQAPPPHRRHAPPPPLPRLLLSDWLDSPASFILSVSLNHGFCFSVFGFVLLFFLSVMWCFSFFFFVCVYNDEGDKALSPKLLHKPFLDDPHPSVWAGHIRVRGIRRGNMRMVRGQWGTIGHLLKPGCSLSSFRTV